MKATFKWAAPYKKDAMNLPVADVDSAIPYYENRLHFRVVSRQDGPQKSVILARDDIQIGLAENGGDPSQEGCFFEVDDLSKAFEEIHGTSPRDADFDTQEFYDVNYRVFFEVAPDGLCYMIGQPI